jgi:hypothetical protein
MQTGKLATIGDRPATLDKVRVRHVEDAVLLFVSLTFSPLTQRATFLAALQLDLDAPKARQDHIAFVTEQLLHPVATDNT